MAISIEDINKLPPRYKILLGVGVFALLGYFYFFYFLQPAMEKKTKLQENLGNLERQIIAKQGVVRQIAQHKKDIAKLEENLKMALNKLPENKEIPGLLRSASEAGTAAGLEFLLFEPMKSEPREFYAEIPVKISVRGLYHDVARFFYAVANLPRIVNVTNMKMGNAVKGEDDRNVLTVDCYLKTYMFLEQKEEKVEEKQDEAKKKK